MKFFGTNLEFDKELMSVSGPKQSFRKLSEEVDTTPRKKSLLKGIGINNNLDLLNYLPFRYDDNTKITPLNEIMNKKVEGKVTLLVTLKSISFRPTKNKKTSMLTGSLTDGSIRDGGASLPAVWFNQPWLLKQLKVGDWMLIIGTVKHEPRTQVSVSVTKKGEKPSSHLQPVYPATDAISSNTISLLIEENLLLAANVVDPIPAKLLNKLEFPTKKDALLAIHKPKTVDQAEFAQQRLAFEELLLWEIGQAYKQYQNRKHPAFVLPQKIPKQVSNWVDSLPFQLSEDQKRVIADIEEDMLSGSPMNRLLMGEVGSGKALSLDSQILLEKGFINMRDAKVGQKIVNPFDQAGTITGVFFQGNRPTWRMVFEDGSFVDCDKDHLWRVENGENAKVVSTQQIIQDLKNNRDWKVPVYANKAKSIKKIIFKGIEPLQCISVSNANGLFVTNDFTITHNTIVSEWAMLRVANEGLQAVMLAPTETLAEQHFRSLSQTLPANFQPTLLSSSKSTKQRKEILNSISMGETKVLVGTHSLLNKEIVYPNLGLVVVDEQHRFGVAQRAALSTPRGENGKTPHTLHMSATPIPRSLALTVYGDLKQSSINKKPNNRKPPQTLLVGQTKWDKVVQKIGQIAEKGEQVFLVCPAVEEDNNLDLDNVTQEFQSIQELYPQFNPVLLHGSMPSEEKEKAMKLFSENKSSIMVATTVIEVGVDVPNATLIVIKGAERFGIAQLHQLRGRVGRGDKGGLCILVGSPSNARLQALRNTDDGFKLAEADLEQRGFGDFLGTRQHGLSGFRIAKLPEDEDLLKRAHNIAQEIIKADPQLENPEHYWLKTSWEQAYGNTG